MEGVFINRMGLTWTDTVALMGAHTLGRGDKDFTGHDGTFVQKMKRVLSLINSIIRKL